MNCVVDFGQSMLYRSASLCKLCPCTEGSFIDSKALIWPACWSLAVVDHEVQRRCVDADRPRVRSSCRPRRWRSRTPRRRTVCRGAVCSRSRAERRAACARATPVNSAA